LASSKMGIEHEEIGEAAEKGGLPARRQKNIERGEGDGSAPLKEVRTLRKLSASVQLGGERRIKGEGDAKKSPTKEAGARKVREASIPLRTRIFPV